MGSKRRSIPAPPLVFSEGFGAQHSLVVVARLLIRGMYRMSVRWPAFLGSRDKRELVGRRSHRRGYHPSEYRSFVRGPV